MDPAVKILELRDRATFVPIIAVRLSLGIESFSSQEEYLLRRAGYGSDKKCVVIFQANCYGLSHVTYDPYDWGDRTYTVAHSYIEKNWNEINPGDVIDIEFILGETTKKKSSEYHEVESQSLGTYE